MTTPRRVTITTRSRSDSSSSSNEALKIGKDEERNIADNHEYAYVALDATPPTQHSKTAIHELKLLPHLPQSTCPNCLHQLPPTVMDQAPSFHTLELDRANLRITELEQQVAIMTTKATAAVDKLADYEDKLKRLSTGAALRALDRWPTSAKEDGQGVGLGIVLEGETEMNAERTMAQYLTVHESQGDSLMALGIPPRPAIADGSITAKTVDKTSELEKAPVLKPPPPPSKFPSFSSFWSGSAKKARQVAAPEERVANPPTQVLAQDGNMPTIDVIEMKLPPAQLTALASQGREVNTARKPSIKRMRTSRTSSSASLSPSPTKVTNKVSEDAITTERALRLTAESDLAALQSELEELSASLFEQANAMVAEARQARAASEARLPLLEARAREAEERCKIAEEKMSRMGVRWEETGNDKERRDARLQALELRVGRVERIRRTLERGSNEQEKQGPLNVVREVVVQEGGIG